MLAFRRRWRLVSSTACSALAVLALAACGGGDTAADPAIPADVASRLASQADGVADALEAGDSCLATERARTLDRAAREAVANGRIDDAFASDLEPATDKLAAGIE